MCDVREKTNFLHNSTEDWTKIEFWMKITHKFDRKPPAGSHVANHWRWLDKWAHKPWLIWRKCFPGDKLEWLVSETQHYPIAYMLTYKLWLKGEGVLSVLSIMISEYKVGSKSFTYKPRRFLSRTCRKPKLSMRYSQLFAINENLNPMKSLSLTNVVKVKPLKLKGHCGMPSAITAFTIILCGFTFCCWHRSTRRAAEER